MNYDATDIAANYDRGRDHGPQLLDLWMNAVASYVQDSGVKKILDLGCGTGRFTEALAAKFDAEVIGVDPSLKMLEQAQKKRRDHRVRYQPGRGEHLPLIDDSVDLIFMSMVFHHFKDPLLAARECRRVLADGGTVCLRAGTFEQISSYPYVPFFPTSRPLMEECLSRAAFVRETFEAEGFRTLGHDIITQKIAPSLECYAEKLAAGADSVLARLSQADFESGMTALRSHAARADIQAVTEPIDFFVFR
jgi:ubiquinone/menaquinone biosynthesis C-methylase UbiE